MKKNKMVLGFLNLGLVFGLASTVACSGNIFVNFADTNTDEALIFEAKQSLDRSDFNGAIAFIELMSADAQARREIVAIKASAFAGRCGFTFLSFIEKIGDSTGGRFFELLMKAMPGASSAKRDDCIASATLLASIDPDAANRTNDENMLMALVSLATMGSIFNNSADTDNDDIVDGGFNHCNTISNADASQLVASLSNTFASLGAIGTASSVAGGDMASLATACTDLATVDPTLDFCSITDVANVTANHRRGMRGVVGSDQGIGLGNSVQAGCEAGKTVVECTAACPP